MAKKADLNQIGSNGIAGRAGMSRRQFMKTTGALAASSVLAAPALAAGSIELVHWSPLAASDGEVWASIIDEFNKAHDGKGVSIRFETVPTDKAAPKLLAAAAAGIAPDFGWGTAGRQADLARDGVIIDQSPYWDEVGMDRSDIVPAYLKAVRYPKYGDGIYMTPMDAMSMQSEYNLDHVAEAGLDPGAYPKTGEELIAWAEAMTRRDGDRILRSGFLLPGSGGQTTVTWGIVSAQMGFERASADLTTACVNPEAGIAAMNWILDMWDRYRVSNRNVADRYKEFGTGSASIFWTGPWTLSGFVGTQKMNMMTRIVPTVGSKAATYYALGGLVMYVQRDESRYVKTMEAIKWLSDNSFKWTTVGRGAAARNSILARPDYKTAGFDWNVRGAFIDGMDIATVGDVPVPDAVDFIIYHGSNVLTRTLDTVWIGEKTPEQAMEELKETWQRSLDRA